MRHIIKIKIKKDNSLESSCVLFLLLMGLLRSYIGFNSVWTMAFLLFFLLMLTRSRYRDMLTTFLVKSASFWLLVVCGMTSAFLGSGEFLFQNVKRWTGVIMTALVFAMLNSNKDFDLQHEIENYFALLNVFWLANLVTVSIQCTGNPFMIKPEWLENNPFYPDQCAGLMGDSGTHRLSMLTIFMMLYNLRIAEKVRGRKKTLMYFYTAVTSLWMLYISTKNDNKTLFLLLPAFLVAYYVIRSAGENRTLLKKISKTGKFLLGGAAALAVVAVFLAMNKNLLEYIQEYVFGSVTSVFSLGKYGGHGSIERLVIATDAIQSGNGLLFGDGLGAAAFSEKISGSYRGYQHFSMSSCGTDIMLGGLWFYLAFCLFITKIAINLLDQRRFSFVSRLICLIAIIGFTIYTVPFENVLLMLWLCLIFVECGADRTAVEKTPVQVFSQYHAGFRFNKLSEDILW